MQAYWWRFILSTIGTVSLGWSVVCCTSNDALNGPSRVADGGVADRASGADSAADSLTPVRWAASDGALLDAIESLVIEAATVGPNAVDEADAVDPGDAGVADAEERGPVDGGEVDDVGAEAKDARGEGATAMVDSGVDAYVDSGRESDASGDSIFDAAPESSAADADLVDAMSDVRANADGNVDTASIILETQGASCRACALQTCFDAGTTCERFAGQTAEGGVASGQSRQVLCQDTLRCVLNTQTACYNAGVMACYCGPRLTGCEEAGAAASAACPAEEANGLETTNPGTVVQRFHDPAFGAGAANNLVECMFNCATCLL